MPLFNLTIDARFKFDEKGKLRVRVLDPKAPGLRLLDVLPSLIGYRIRKAEKVFRRIAQDDRDVHYFQKVADGFRLRVVADDGFQARIPKTGPLLIVANHPLNGIDGIALASVVSRVRPDLKIMLTTTFDGIPGLKDHAIFVNASNGPSARNRAEPVREAIAALENGNPVALFPAGQGSYIEVPGRHDPVDVPWNKGVTTFLKSSRAQVLPVYIEGSPSRLFLRTRRFYHPLSTLFLLREILLQEGTTVRLRVGTAVSKQEVVKNRSREAQAEYLRTLTYALAEQDKPGKSNRQTRRIVS